jgi:sugar phosphate isomerase/epimerase
MDTAVRSLDALGTAKELGYDGIGWKLHKPAELAAAVELTRKHGLRLFAVYGGANLTKSGLTTGGGSDLRDELAALKGSGAMLWLPIFSKEFAASAEEGDEIAVPALCTLADRAAENGVRIALYPHTGAWIERVQDTVRIARKVNRENLGATFNLCHCLMVGDEAKIPALLAEAAPHLFVVTINGADKDAGRTNWGRLIRPLDEGDYDVRTVLAILRELKWNGPIGLQGFGVKLPVEENLSRSMNAWKALNR